MTKACLYCNLQFPDDAEFCPNCGRPVTSGFQVRTIEQIEVERLGREIQKKDRLIQILIMALARWGAGFRGSAQSIGHRRGNGENGRRATTKFSMRP
jgi:hypothetical protein